MAATVLVVDADLSTSRNWELLFEANGYKVIAADNGNSALEQCRGAQPDLVLLSSALPGLSGLEVCRHLKSAPLTRYTPVVVMLPAAELPGPLPSKQEAMEAGADDFWGPCNSQAEALNRVQTVLQLKSYIDRQAEAVVLSLARSLDAKDPGTEGHSERLVCYALQLATDLGFSGEELAVLRIASLLHDIGKVAIPDAVLSKPGRLTPVEMELMRQHPVVGENICAPLRSFREALPAIRHHHERVDGSGYPDRLKGEEIPLHARIVQIADIYDALTTDRPYREAMAQEWALAVMMTEAYHGWLDLSLVSRFVRLRQENRFLAPPRVPGLNIARAGLTACKTESA